MTRSKGLRIFRVNTVHSATVLPFRLLLCLTTKRKKRKYNPLTGIYIFMNFNESVTGLETVKKYCPNFSL